MEKNGKNYASMSKKKFGRNGVQVCLFQSSTLSYHNCDKEKFKDYYARIGKIRLSKIRLG